MSKRARWGSLVGVGVSVGAVSLCSLVGGCSSDSSGGTNNNNNNNTTPELGQPPAEPEAPATTSTTKMNFAVKKIILGDQDASGKASTTAWKKIGFNLDGKVSTSSSTDVCKNPGNSSAVHNNGENGIDNAFGGTVLQSLVGLRPTISKELNDFITSGSFTIMLNVTGLTDPTQTATSLPAESYAGGKFNADASKKPTFTKSDDWPVLSSGSSVTPLTTFSSGYVVDGRWVARERAAVLSLKLFGVPLRLDLNQAVVTFKYDGNGVASAGTLAGIINGAQLEAEVKKVAGQISSSLCGDGFKVISDQVKAALDIMSDGTNAAGRDCDGISFGIGFEAAEIGPPKTVAPAEAAGEDKCAAK